MKLFNNDLEMGESYGSPSYDQLSSELQAKQDEITELRSQVAKLMQERTAGYVRKPCTKEYCISCKYLDRSPHYDEFYCGRITKDSYEARIYEDCDSYPLQLEIYNPAKFGCVLYEERYIIKGDKNKKTERL